MSLEKSAEKLRHAAEHAAKSDKPDRSSQQAAHESEAETAGVHAELTHSKNNKGYPPGDET